MIRASSDWVSAYLDRGNTVSVDGVRIVATRAITTQGRLIWLVANRHLSRAYHSRKADPHAAMAEADIVIEQTAPGEYHIARNDADTFVNGAASDTLGGVTKNVTISSS